MMEKMETKQNGNVMKTMETEHVNAGKEWKQDGNMMETMKTEHVIGHASEFYSRLIL